MRNILLVLGLLEFIKSARTRLLIKSLLKSNKQRGESELKDKLSMVVPDLTDQYTTHKTDMRDTYFVEKTRCQHAFQINLALKAIKMVESKKDRITVVDIGDSAGTHLSYLTNKLIYNGKELNTLSINLDPIAIKKIRSKGKKAILARAEDLHQYNIHADIFLSFEMLEHLFDPISFLHSISEKANCKIFVITVPYVQKSRVGMHQLRRNSFDNIFAENTHIFELCPADWDLIFRFSGWKVLHSDRYTQFPKLGSLNLMKYEWRRFDFDGFYGVILEKDRSVSEKYKSWEE